MHVTLAFALFSILLVGAPVFAQSPCVDCLKAAQEQLKQCLGNAISQEDKKSCAEKQDARAKACESGECTIARGQSGHKSEGPPGRR